MRRIHRRDIKNFARNPRSITEDARRTLKRNLDVDKGGVGLIAPVTWNETTGQITGGHQRIAALDALEGSDDYLLDVAVVKLTQTEETQANLLLNNANAQGQWDEDLLAALLKSTPDLNLEATAFTVADLELSFSDPELSSIFTPNAATSALMGEVEALKADSTAQKKKTRAGAADSSSDSDPDDGEPTGNTGDAAKAFRKKGKEQFNEQDDTEVVAHVICKNRAERERFVERMGYGPEERYVDASRVWSRLKEAVPTPT